MNIENDSGYHQEKRNWSRPETNSETDPETNPATKPATNSEIKSFPSAETIEIGEKYRVEFGMDTKASALHPYTNEDHWAFKPHTRSDGRNALMVAIFDGLGGAKGGELASRAASRGFMQQVRQNDHQSTGFPLIDATLNAVRELQNELSKDEGLKNSGCTLAAVDFYQDRHTLRLEMVSSGDSRIYILRDGELYQASVDDDGISSSQESKALTRKRANEIRAALNEAVSQEDLDDEAAIYFMYRHLISGGLTLRTPVDIGTFDKRHSSTELLDGDLILLTSDGVHDNLTKSEIARILNRAMGLDLSSEEIAQALVRAAYLRSTKDKATHLRSKADDITAQVIKMLDVPLHNY